MTPSLADKVSKRLFRNRWEWLIRLRWNNRRLNRLVRPISSDELKELPVVTLELSTEDYREFVAAPGARSFARLPYAHSKMLEYLTTLRLLRIGDGMHLLDAAGGSLAEYLRIVRHHVPGVIGYVQDPIVPTETESPWTLMAGSIERIPLPDNSLDAISCHHSIEHFRGDLDSQFIAEALRVLKPGGRLAIAPLFLTNLYSEIWNRAPEQPCDPAATVIVDRTATFCGWGPYEGFARTYNLAAFRRRILDRLPADAHAQVYRVLLDGRPAPDLAVNRHQPRLNGEMKALLITKGASHLAERTLA
jgi:hypothetical protein